MININLLPWRTFQRERERKTTIFFAIICGAILLCSWVASHIMLNKKNQQMHDITVNLEQQLTIIKNKANKKQNSNLLTHIRSNQIELITWMNLLTKNHFANIQWQTIFSQDGSLLLTGKSDTFSAVLYFIQQAKQVGLNFEVNNLTQRADDLVEFSLRLVKKDGLIKNRYS